MLAKSWRVSHLVLALASLVFLLVASITGVILSTEPVQQSFVTPKNSKAVDTTSLSTIIPLLQDTYIETFSLEVDENKGVKVSVIGWDEDADGDFYIDPATGEKIGEIQKQSAFYQWNTSLHRSLFLHKTGRIIMGVTSFFLLFITISGIALVINRTQGFKNIFKKIEKQQKASYYHTILGRLLFIPIFLISISGSYLFVATMNGGVLEEEQILTLSEGEEIDAEHFPIFKNTKLSEIISLDFPFSSDEDDYFVLKKPNQTININQYTGQTVSIENISKFNQVQRIANTIHTGQGHPWWAIIIGLVSLNLLYFIYSGFRISWLRLASKSSNKIKVEKAEIIILVGSENGSTQHLASLLLKSLLKTKHLAFLADLNQYQHYPNAKHLVILTATYGDGEAPYNARNFLKKIQEVKQSNVLKTHLIGFGSMSYPKFCQYAIDIRNALKKHEDFELTDEPMLIHGQSYTSFQLSIDEWKNREGFKFNLPQNEDKKEWPEIDFKVVDKKAMDDGYTLTFILELKPLKKVKYKPGDLLAITPPKAQSPRFYSIGTAENGNILLSIRKHEYGVCSTYLYELEKGDVLNTQLKVNKDFHLPRKGEVLMIANGTGVAPFIGMARQNPKQLKTMFYGGRALCSFELYREKIEVDIRNKYLDKVHFAFSKEEYDDNYVQQLVEKYQDEIVRILLSKGTIMICGSLKMRDGVIEVIKDILNQRHGREIEEFILNKQILMDCY